jgi:hypothetical protein
MERSAKWMTRLSVVSCPEQRRLLLLKRWLIGTSIQPFSQSGNAVSLLSRYGINCQSLLRKRKLRVKQSEVYVVSMCRRRRSEEHDAEC